MDHLIRLVVRSHPSPKGHVYVQTPLDIQELSIDGASVLNRVWSIDFRYEAEQVTRATVVLVDINTGAPLAPVEGAVEFAINFPVPEESQTT